MSTPTWSPDGLEICFSASVDYVGEHGGRANELFTVSFDPAAAAAGDPPLDADLQRITFTTTEPGDPITGLHNYAPVYDPTGSLVYFVSSRRAPASTQRGRSLWSVTADGRLEPEILFFSREDDVDPDVAPDGTVVVSSGLGFPTEMLDALQNATLDSLYAMNDTLQPPRTEFEILRLAEDERVKLEAYGTGVMAQIFLFRKR
jgi:Tol biopolymer transport system component